MKKVLIAASVPSMIGQFNMNNIRLLQEMGYEAEAACDFGDRSVWTQERVEKLTKELKEKGVKTHQIDFSRSIWKVTCHIKAYRQLKELLEEGKYEFLHCHTPIASALARLAGHRTGTKIIYTAHGFHFYKGAPLINWILYYPVEKYLSRYTHVLITINKEDYERAKAFHAKRVEYVPGVGIDTEKIQAVQVDRKIKRKELFIPEDAMVLLSVGEVNRNKNHQLAIKAVSKLKKRNLYYIICGKGRKTSYIGWLSEKLKVKDQIRLLGFREDVIEIGKCADIFIFPSRREGLGLAAIEAMACGLPLVTSNVHGMNDYSEDGVTGYKVAPNDVRGLAEKIEQLYENETERKNMEKTNKERSYLYDIRTINEKMRNIYRTVAKENEN